ncbi:TM2 domain-containing protein [Flavobacterium sp. ST-75]|uniref:TM2 domain-containing protein n=1 Tax=Flavobacterium rhizophilum TaxID=3163296 RepID=A0ABW8YC16_9FLAO
MDTQKVDLFMMINGKYFKAEHLNYIREKLLGIDETKWNRIMALDFKDPNSIMLVSLIGPGALGVDRFLIGETGTGVAKLLTCGGLGIWTIIDWFIIMDLTRDKNMEKLQAYL